MRREQDNSVSTIEGAAVRQWPAWITRELIADTLRVWQPYSLKELTESDAVTILQDVGRLVDVLEHTS